MSIDPKVTEAFRNTDDFFDALKLVFFGGDDLVSQAVNNHVETVHDTEKETEAEVAEVEEDQNVVIDRLIKIEEHDKERLIRESESITREIESLKLKLDKAQTMIVFKNGRLSMLKQLKKD